MTVLDLVRPEHPAAAAVLAAIEREDDLHHPEEFAPPHGAFVVIRDGDETMAGGGLRRVSDGVGEIRRMWTAPLFEISAHWRRAHAPGARG